MPKMPGRAQAAVPVRGGRPKADFSALGRAIRRFFAYYPRLAPLPIRLYGFQQQAVSYRVPDGRL